MDGVPASTQCPIPTDHSFTYQLKAELYGSTWYHGHYSGQYTDRATGLLIVHGPKNVPYDVQLGLIMLSDQYRSSYFPMEQSIAAPSLNPPIPTGDNNLINGKINFNYSQVPSDHTCTNNAGLSKFRFQSGKTHRLRLINSGAEGTQQFSIDNHIMTVTADDFVPGQPYNTTVVTLGIGDELMSLLKAPAILLAPTGCRAKSLVPIQISLKRLLSSTMTEQTSTAACYSHYSFNAQSHIYNNNVP